MSNAQCHTVTPTVTRRVTDAVSLHRSPLPPTRPDPKVLKLRPQMVACSGSDLAKTTGP